VPDLDAAVLLAFGTLGARRTRCALIGGLAVGVRAEPRTTRDGDLAVAVADDAEADAVVFSLGALGYRPDGVFEQEVTGRIALVRLVGPAPERLRLDLTFEMSGIEREVVDAATSAEVEPWNRVPVAQRGHLVALKVLAFDEDKRPQDRVDILALLKKSTPDDVDLARKAVKLITKRGYNRGRDLAGDLERFIAIVKRLRAT
jgi:hypothetical protein